MEQQKKSAHVGATISTPKVERARVSITPALFDAILDCIADGATLDKLCLEPGMPSRSAVYGFMRAIPGARARMDEATGQRADWRAGKIHDLAAQVEAGTLDPQAARVAIDAHRFLAAREAPGRYGDRAAIEHTGKDGKDLLPEPKPMGNLELARGLAYICRMGARELEEASGKKPPEGADAMLEYLTSADPSG